MSAAQSACLCEYAKDGEGRYHRGDVRCVNLNIDNLLDNSDRNTHRLSGQPVVRNKTDFIVNPQVILCWIRVLSSQVQTFG